ncbi:MAG TPA: DUF1343 domain-containing protein [Chthoniobacteraceae bacterium]|jgi:uncharacterized protein YbbC (DUF1343 family)
MNLLARTTPLRGNVAAVIRPVILLLLLAMTLRAAPVELGIDRLQQMNFVQLAGKRVGLVTNQTGVNSAGVKTRVILSKARNVNLVALFTPEHGLDGTELAGKYVSSRKDRVTGVIAHSLYGPTRKPTPAMLRGIDVLVYDMQDIGCRSYTYVSTMGKCMQAAAEAGIEFMVLDRPNPLGGMRVEGPPVEPRWISFVGQFPVPYVHGLTVGELAKMSNAKQWMGPPCRLTVIEMRGWERRMTWRSTGLRWVQTSPNIPRADSPAYYVVTGLVGSLGGIEAGVGGPTPFEVIAFRGADAASFTGSLERLGFDGISYEPYASGPWQGARLRIDPDRAGSLCSLAVYLIASGNRFATPGIFARSPAEKLDIFYKCYGSQSIRAQIEGGTPAPRIVDGWRASVQRFEGERAPYLLY